MPDIWSRLGAPTGSLESRTDWLLNQCEKVLNTLDTWEVPSGTLRERVVWLRETSAAEFPAVKAVLDAAGVPATGWLYERVQALRGQLDAALLVSSELREMLSQSRAEVQRVTAERDELQQQLAEHEAGYRPVEYRKCSCYRRLAWLCERCHPTNSAVRVFEGAGSCCADLGWESLENALALILGRCGEHPGTVEVGPSDALLAWRLAGRLYNSGLQLRVVVNQDWRDDGTWALWAPCWPQETPKIRVHPAYEKANAAVVSECRRRAGME